MLPKNRRIERRFFDQITRLGKRYHSGSFVLYITQIKQEKTTLPSRFAFSVSKKVSKLAAERNKLRRRGYSIIGKNIKMIKPNFFCFFSYKKGFQKDFELLEAEIIRLLSLSLVII